VNVFPALSPDIPSKFVWAFADDKEGLKHYIDLILTGQRSEATMVEATGAITEQEMFHLDRPQDQVINVNIRRFVDYLLLRDRFSVPLWGKVKFITDQSNIIPREFIAAIAQILGEDGKFLDPNRPWKHCTEKDLEAMGLKPSDVTSSMNRGKFSSHAASPSIESTFVPPEETDVPAPPPQEVEMRRDAYRDYVDLLTQVRPEEGDPYFVRRIISLRGPILWAGSAYRPNGPWKVWQRDNAQLLALGLNL
jgi:hypothetical protein